MSNSRWRPTCAARCHLVLLLRAAALVSARRAGRRGGGGSGRRVRRRGCGQPRRRGHRGRRASTQQQRGQGGRRQDDAQWNAAAQDGEGSPRSGRGPRQWPRPAVRPVGRGGSDMPTVGQPAQPKRAARGSYRAEHGDPVRLLRQAPVDRHRPVDPPPPSPLADQDGLAALGILTAAADMAVAQRRACALSHRPGCCRNGRNGFVEPLAGGVGVVMAYFLPSGW